MSITNYNYYPDGWTITNRNAKFGNINLFYKGLLPTYWASGFGSGAPYTDWWIMALRLDINNWNQYYSNTTCSPGSACRTNLGSFFYEFPKESNNVPVEFIPGEWVNGSVFTIGKVAIWGPEQSLEKRYWGFFGLVPDTTIYSIDMHTGFNIAIPENVDSFCDNNYDLLRGVSRDFVTGDIFDYNVLNGILFGISTSGSCVFNGRENFVLVVKSNGTLYRGNYTTNISPSTTHNLSVRSFQGSTILSVDSVDRITVPTVPLGKLKPLWGIASFSDNTNNGASSPEVYFKNINIVTLLPANIVSTALTVNTNSCYSPCTITGSVTWTNNGDIAGIFNPAILVNGDTISLGTNVPINPNISNAITITFSLSNYPDGSYNIYASPGTHYQTVNITTCVPNWQCRPSLDGYEYDINNCGIPDRLNPACNPACASITLTSDKPSAFIGNTIALTINSIPLDQLYIAEIRDQNNTPIGNCPTTGGICSINWLTTGLTAGQYNLTASVGTQCTSSPLSITLLEQCTSLSIIPDKTSATIGDPVVLTINSSPPSQQYNVNITDSNDNIIGSCTTSGGTCPISWLTTGLLEGQYILTARITDVIGEGCASSPLSIALSKVCPSITLIPDKTSTFIGDPVVLTINSDPPDQSYTLEIRDQNDNLIGDCISSDGTCSINWSTTGLSAGQYNLTVRATDFGLEECGTYFTSVILTPPISLMDSAWPRFHGDIRNSGYADVDSTANGSIKWEIQLSEFHSGAEIGSPAIATDGTIYVTDNFGHHLFAINPNGTLKWTYDLWSLWLETEFGYDYGPFDATEMLKNPVTGFHPAPAIDNNGTIYITGDSKSSQSWLVAINPDGTLKWYYATWGYILSPLSIGNGSIYTTVSSEGASPIAIDQNGLRKWYSHTPGLLLTSPVISNDSRIWISASSGLYIIDSLNEDFISGPYGDGSYFIDYAYNIALNAELNSPIMSKDGTVYIVDTDNSSLLAINPTTYETIWQSPYLGNQDSGERAYQSTPVIDDDNNIYVLSSTDVEVYPVINTLHSISPIDGHINWSYNVGSTDYRTNILLVDKNTVYTYGTIGNNFSFIAINKDGTLKWHSNTDTFRSSPAMESNGIIYVGTYYGSLVAFDFRTPANITATTITPSSTTCSEPCNITVDVTWTNTGEATGSFIPSIKIDDTAISPEQYSSEEIISGDIKQHTFTITGLAEGNHTICAIPSTIETCTTVTAIHATGDVNFHVTCEYNPCVDAHIMIGTNIYGPTDISGTITVTGLPSGSTNYTVSKTGYYDGSQNVTVVTGSLVDAPTVNLVLIPTTGDINFHVTCEGTPCVDAHIMIGTNTYGPTDISGTITVRGLPPGSTNYTASKTGYYDGSQNVTVVTGSLVDAPTVDLVLIHTTGDVCIKSNPSGASIIIDGITQHGKITTMSETSCIIDNTIVGLSPGTDNHSYEINLTGYEPKSGNFSITAGILTEIDTGHITPIPATAGSGWFALLSLGFLYGLILNKKMCGNKRTKEECEKTGCQWKDGKCIERKKL